MSNDTAQVLPGTTPLTLEGDLAAQMVAALDRYVTEAVARSPEKREALWHRDYSSHGAYVRSVEPNRERLRKQIGCLDARLPIEELSYIASTRTAAQVTEGENYTVSRVRWRVFDEVEGEGLLLEPEHDAPVSAQVVALPDADWTPEMIAGVTDDLPANARFAQHLAKAGCRVVVPLLINRDDTCSGNPALGAMTNQPHREFIYRMAFELGRNIIGYEVAPRPLIVETSRGPEVDGPPAPRQGRGGAAPGQLVSPPIDSVKAEFERARGFYRSLCCQDAIRLVFPEDGLPGSRETLSTLLAELGVQEAHVDGYRPLSKPDVGDFDCGARQKRQVMQLVDLTQRFLREAATRRQEFFWERTDTSSLTRWAETCGDFKSCLQDEVIGRCPPPDAPADPRTRLLYDEPGWKGYEVVLDVWKDVFAYGILLLPKDLQPGRTAVLRRLSARAGRETAGYRRSEVVRL